MHGVLSKQWTANPGRSFHDPFVVSADAREMKDIVRQRSVHDRRDQRVEDRCRNGFDPAGQAGQCSAEEGKRPASRSGLRASMSGGVFTPRRRASSCELIHTPMLPPTAAMAAPVAE